MRLAETEKMFYLRLAIRMAFRLLDITERKILSALVSRLKCGQWVPDPLYAFRLKSTLVSATSLLYGPPASLPHVSVVMFQAASED